jgi:hypothetical protein
MMKKSIMCSHTSYHCSGSTQQRLVVELAASAWVNSRHVLSDGFIPGSTVERRLTWHRLVVALAAAAWLHCSCMS